MDSSGFMSKYYDWAAFESFVRDLHIGDGDVTVERDVTDQDRYGAKRQTDVKITRRTRFQVTTTLVECKRWKEPVSRDRIDVLASSIEALGANDGAIFTTSGYEAGAIAYARGKGIELFVVRDLTPEEWGLPGRHISLHLQVNSGAFRNVSFNARALMLTDGPEEAGMLLEFEIDAKKALNPDFDLFSVKSGERGPNLVSIFADAHQIILAAICNSIGVLEDGKPLTLEISALCELDLTRTEYHQLRLPRMAARIECIGFDFKVHVNQSQIKIDRAQDLDFAVMVESYVSDQRLIAHKRLNETDIVFTNPKLSDNADSNTMQPLENGSLVRANCSPWVGIGEAVASKNGFTEQFIQVIVETDGRKPRLSLRTHRPKISPTESIQATDVAKFV